MDTKLTHIISRDASDKSKGFRFQKLRAVGLLFDAFLKTEGPWVYCAIENMGDVMIHNSSHLETKTYIEEDKNYSDTSFSLNSPQVLNSLVSFIDTWVKQEMSNKIFFGFVTNANIAKENRTGKIKELNLELPVEPIIKLLSNKTYKDPKTLKTVKSLIIDEYSNQYKNKEGAGYLSIITSWEDSTWIEFIEKIKWHFGHCDEKVLESELYYKFRNTSLYNSSLQDKEGHVVSLLVDLFDKKQNSKDFCDKFIHGADLQVIALQVSSLQYSIPDPSWKIWESLPPPSDKRNIIDKVQAVIPNIKRLYLDGFCRRTALSKIEQSELSCDKSILSLKYQIYSSCIGKLDELKSATNSNNLTAQTLEIWISELIECANAHLTELKKDFKYPLQNKDAIRGLILDLVDTCFFSFESDNSIQ